MSKFTIYSSTGVTRAITDSLELHDEWMAECYLVVSVKSATPINFAIGDYIDYRNERYTIQYDPTILKKASSGSYGEGFTYDNIKFVNDAQSKVVLCDFNDIVLNDNELHYTSLPTFPFYCETVDDLLDRIQANLEDLYPEQFIIICLDKNRTLQRGLAVDRQAEFEAAYNEYIGDGEYTYEKTSVALTADNITCWDAIKMAHDYFGLNFIMRGSVIIVGTAGVNTPTSFRYGKGNGLYELERIGDSEQQIVTRLRAYGNSTNLPSRYYANLNMQIYGTSIAAGEGDVTVDVDFRTDYFINPFSSGQTSIQVRIGNTDYPNALAWINGVTGQIVVHTGTSDAIAEGTKIYFTGGVNEDAWPSDHREYSSNNLPDNMAVSRLMLPNFPNGTLHDWVQAHKDLEGYEWLAQAVSDGFTFSTNQYRPYIDSPNKIQYGVRPASIYFDGSNETDDIYPTLEGTGLDVVYAAEQIQDNGIYDSGEVPNFKITLPNLGFDLGEYWQKYKTGSIVMKDGMCGSRSFEIANKPTQSDDNRWVCEVKRCHDESLDLYFPYKDFNISNGDHYVLTDIDMPSTYVDLNAERLLKAAIDALRKNHTPRFTYQPRIDEVFMAKQDDAAKASGGTLRSLHDTLKAGDYFSFQDTDLGINASIIIDVLTIRENGNNGIPTYEVTLRDEKTVSAIQKVQNKVDSILSGNEEHTRVQLDSQIEQYGNDHFLSKVHTDTAKGLIGFNKGLTVGTFNSGLLGTGSMIDPRGHAEFESIFSRSFISTPEFRFNRINVTEGEQWCTNGYGTIESVVVGKDENGNTIQNGGLITLHLEENDYTSVAAGDICRGIYNDIANEYTTQTVDDDKDIAGGTSAQEGTGIGFPAKTGFFTSYFYIVRMVKNEKGNCQFIYGLRKSTTPHPCAYMKFAQYGSFTDSTRRASSYTSSINHAYEMRLEGVATWLINTANIVSREGWLGDLTIEMADHTQRTLQGYGLYVQDNVYFGNAVIQLDPYTLEMLERDLATYDVNLSGHVSAVQVDNHGYIIGGIYTDTGSGGSTAREYRIHTAITVRRSGTLLTEAASDAEAGTGTYKITYNTVGCTCMIENSTVYITHIDNLLNTPSADPSSIDEDAMKAMESCRVDLIIDCEGRASIQKSILIAINHDGQDGKGVEYIFITKNSWDGTEQDKPTIYDVAADRQVDDYCPYTDAQHTDQWTDEPSGVGDNQKYEFYAQRKQINGIWQPFGEVKLWNTYVVDGVTPYLMDLSNEQSQIACDENGSVTGSYETSKLMIFKGTSYAFTDFSTITITPTNIKCNGNSSAFTLTAAQIAQAQSDGYFLLTPSAISSNSATISISAVYGNITLVATYKINKSYAGKNGVIYSLIPSLDTIRRYGDGGSLVDTTLTLQVKKTVGATAIILTTYAELQNDGLSLTYDNASASGTSLTDISIATSTFVGNSGNGTWGKINLKKGSIIVDSERINVVKDGNTGATGDDGLYYQKQYAKGSSRSSAPSSGWQDTSPSPTSSEPYIWERSRLYNPNTGTAGNWTYTCLTGATGSIGDTGPMYYPAGVYSSTKQYDVTSYLCPVVLSSNDSNATYYYAKKSSYGVALSNTEYWGAFSMFEAIFVNILFANFAHLGGFIIYGNRFFSQKGTINGSESTSYTDSSFEPYLEMDAANGTLKARRGYVGGFVIGDTYIGQNSATGSEDGYTYIARNGYAAFYKNSSSTEALRVTGTLNVYGTLFTQQSSAQNINGSNVNINTTNTNGTNTVIGSSANTLSVNANKSTFANEVAMSSILSVAGVASFAANIKTASFTLPSSPAPKVGQFYFCKGLTADVTVTIPTGYKIMHADSRATSTSSMSFSDVSFILVYVGSSTWVQFYCG